MLQPIHTFIHRIGRLVLLDRAADPAANGELQRNATHVKVYSGGAVRNLSDVGASPSHTHASHTGIGTGDHHAQLHAAAGADELLLSNLGGAVTDGQIPATIARDTELHAESHTHASHTGIGTGDHHAQLHAAAHQPGGGDAMAVDAAAATGSLRTLGAGATQGAAGNHTHAGGAETSASADVATSETTTSTSYTDLATAGPAVTLSPGSTQNHLIWVSAHFYTFSTGTGAFMSVAVAGAAATDANSIRTGQGEQTTGCRPIYAASVANGSTHTAKYRTNNASFEAAFVQRRIVATTT